MHPNAQCLLRLADVVAKLERTMVKIHEGSAYQNERIPKRILARSRDALENPKMAGHRTAQFVRKWDITPLADGSQSILSHEGKYRMAINLLDSVKDALAGQVADQIGSAIGLDKQQTASALKAVVPMMIGGMMKKASTPSGASELSKALQDTDTSILDNLGGLLGGGEKSSGPDLMSMGAKLIPMLFGSNQGNIVSTLVKLLGVNEKSIGSLISLVLPIVMAVVGKQAKSAGGFDVGSLTNLLGGQKNFLAGAVPSELQGALGMVGDLASSASRTAEAATSSNPLQWLLPLIAVAVLGYIGYNFLTNKPQAEQPQAEKTTTPQAGVTTAETTKEDTLTLPSLPAVPDLTDVKKSLTATFEGLTGTLEGIKDEDGAKNALGKIEEAAKAYTQLGVDKLPAVAQTALAPFLKPYLTKLQEVIDGLYAIPGVKDIIDPVLGPMIKTVQSVGG